MTALTSVSRYLWCGRLGCVFVGLFVMRADSAQMLESLEPAHSTIVRGPEHYFFLVLYLRSTVLSTRIENKRSSWRYSPVFVVWQR